MGKVGRPKKDKDLFVGVLEKVEEPKQRKNRFFDVFDELPPIPDPSAETAPDKLVPLVIPINFTDNFIINWDKILDKRGAELNEAFKDIEQRIIYKGLHSEVLNLRVAMQISLELEFLRKIRLQLQRMKRTEYALIAAALYQDSVQLWLEFSPDPFISLQEKIRMNIIRKFLYQYSTLGFDLTKTKIEQYRIKSKNKPTFN